MNFDLKDSIAVLALLLGILNSWHTYRITRRDSGNLKVTCTNVESHKPPTYKAVHGIRVEIVNIGRRVVILKTIWVDYDNGSSAGSGIGNNGHKLSENERFVVQPEEVEQMLRNLDGSFAVAIYVEDTIGKKYYARNSQFCIERYFIECGKPPDELPPEMGDEKPA